MESSQHPNKRLDHALSDWKSWNIKASTAPDIIGQLTGGETNLSYVISNSGNKLVLRLHNPNSERFGIDRTQEQIIWNAVAKNGLSANLIYSDTTQTYCVYKYIEGDAWQPQDFENEQQLERLFELLDKAQKIELNLPRFDYHARISLYMQHTIQAGILPKDIQDAWASFEPELKNTQQSDWHPVICHHDPIPSNIIENETGIYLIDWEYAGLGMKNIDEAYARSKAAMPRFNTQIDFMGFYRAQYSIEAHICFWLRYLWYALASLDSND